MMQACAPSKGAFHLAAQARVPIVPISITFEQPKVLPNYIEETYHGCSYWATSSTSFSGLENGSTYPY